MKGARLKFVLALVLAIYGRNCWAWGDEGHAVIAQIAMHYLTPATRQKVAAILAGDTGALTTHDIAGESSWADKYRDSDREQYGANKNNNTRYRQTHRWHFVNLDLDTPNLARACFQHRPLAPGQLASQGPAQACVIDKITQFRSEWLAPRTSPAERLLALQFLLHLVGDLHQPLHASNNDDQGGNSVIVSGPKLKRSNLHRLWDTQLVQRLDRNGEALALRLIAQTSAAQYRQWQQGDPASWALEAHALAKNVVYGQLPRPTSTDDSSQGSPQGVTYRLPASYIANAESVTATQLIKAGIRLAMQLEPNAE
ncbi:MAG TPA: S1/P1 nuclease [Spongiibacteraceae bacterium]|nr:S1/P1 nuclease [Spongiibacteraceae bacterium]